MNESILERMRRTARGEVTGPLPVYNPEEGDTFASPETDPVLGRPRPPAPPVTTMDLTAPGALTPRERSANPDDAALYQAADDTNFQTLVQGIHDDPLGRGAPAPSNGPVNAYAPPLKADPQEMALRPAARQAPAPAAPEPSPTQAPAPAAAPKVDAGQAPPPAFWSVAKTLPNSFLNIAGAFGKHGGKRKVLEGIQERNAQSMDMVGRDAHMRDDYARRKAALERAAVREAKLDARYNDDKTYSRGRDAAQDARQADETQWSRGRIAASDEREKAKFEAWLKQQDPTVQAQAREQAFEMFKRETTFSTDEDIRKARALAKARGAGAGGRKGADPAVYAAAYQRLVAIHGSPDKIPPQALAALDQAMLAKDPAKEALAIGKDANTAQAKSAAVTTKTRAAAETANKTLSEVRRLKQVAMNLKAQGRNYIPTKEPLGDVGTLARRGMARMFGSDKGGTTGYTPEETDLLASGKIVGSAMFQSDTNQVANLMAEQDKAEARIMSNGSIDGLIQALEIAEQRLDGAVKAGKIYARDENGYIIDPGATGGSVARTKDGEEIELVD